MLQTADVPQNTRSRIAIITLTQIALPWVTRRCQVRDDGSEWWVKMCHGGGGGVREGVHQRETALGRAKRGREVYRCKDGILFLLKCS